jgi:hypothetical protein
LVHFAVAMMMMVVVVVVAATHMYISFFIVKQNYF